VSNPVSRRDLAEAALGTGLLAGLGDWPGFSRADLPVPSDGWFNVLTFGAKGDGVADDTAGLQAAITAAGKRTLFFPPGVYRTTKPLLLDSGQLKLMGSGAQGTTTILKEHAGDGFVVNHAQVEMHFLAIEGRPAAAGAGIGVNVAGAGENFRFIDCSIAFIDIGIQFAADAGQGAMIANCRIAPFTTTPGREGCSIRVRGPDTVARDRHVVNLSTGAGTLELFGALDFFVTNCIVRNIFTDPVTFGLHVVNCRIGSLGRPVTFDGRGCSYIGCMIAGDVTLARTLVASTFVGNMATEAKYTFTDLSIPGNNLVLHGVHTEGKYLNKHLIPNVAGRTFALSGMSPDRGDRDVTLLAQADAPVQRFATPLSADRTITLSSQSAYPGARFRIVRTGLGPFQLRVGQLKAMPAGTAATVDVEFDGTAWVLTGYGLL